MRKLIAITGKIGSGKSSVLEYLAKKGYKVLSADLIYKQMLQTDEDLVKEISLAIGVSPITSNGKLTLDKPAVKQIVFADRDKLKLLNSITHPKIMKKMLEIANSYSGAVFCEIPLLAESGCDNYFSWVWEIVRDNNTRLNSVKDRDEISTDLAKKITQNQQNYEIKEGIEHTFIYNDSTLEDLYKKVDALEKSF